MSTTTSTDASTAFAAIFNAPTSTTTQEDTQAIAAFIGPSIPPHLKPQNIDETKEKEKKISKTDTEEEEDIEMQQLCDDELDTEQTNNTNDEMNDGYELIINYDSHNSLLDNFIQQRMQNSVDNIPLKSRLMYEYKTSKYHVTSCEMQGYRDAMEDKHLIHFKFNDIGNNFENVSVFGIFDGHGGDLVSKFIKTHFISVLESNMNELDFDDESIDAQNKIRNVFKQLDEKWIAFENKSRDIKEDDVIEDTYARIGMNDYGSVGSTMIVCIVKYYPIHNHFKVNLHSFLCMHKYFTILFIYLIDNNNKCGRLSCNLITKHTSNTDRIECRSQT